MAHPRSTETRQSTRHRNGHWPGTIRGQGNGRAPERPGAFQPVLTIRASVSQEEVASFTRKALQEIRVYINEHDLAVDGPPFSICRPLPHHRVDVETGWPAVGPSSRHVHSGALPSTRLRTAAAPSYPGFRALPDNLA